MVFFEPIERRCYFASVNFVPDSGIARLNLGSTADRVFVFADKNDPDRILVRVNGETFDLNATLLKAIKVNLGGSNDWFQVDVTDGEINAPMTINGGDGHDTIVGGSANDVLSGGEGNDKIGASSGHDKLWGQAGDDRLFGENGNDRIDGGDGNDYLLGEGKGLKGPFLRGNHINSFLAGGTPPDGQDLLLGGAGEDTLSGGGRGAVSMIGNDQLIGGDGNDLLQQFIDEIDRLVDDDETRVFILDLQPDGTHFVREVRLGDLEEWETRPPIE